MTNNADGYNNPPPNYNTYPLQYTPTAQNPTIVPDINPPVVFPGAAGAPGEVVSALSPSQYLQSFPRQPASGTVVFTGSVTTGNTSYIALENPILPGGVIYVGTVSSATDTLTTIAERLVTFINQNALLQQYGVTASIVSGATNPTVSISWQGPVGGFCVLSSGSIVSKETLTVGGSVSTGDVLTLTLASNAFSPSSACIQLSGSATEGDVITVTTFNPLLANSNSVDSITVGATPTLASVASQIATALNDDTTLDILSISAVAQNNNVWITWSNTVPQTSFAVDISLAATETLGLVYNQPSGSGLAPSPAPSSTITVGGSATTGDVLTLFVNAPYAFGYYVVPVVYTVPSDSSLDTIATGIATAINSNTVLQGAGFAATVVGAVITVVWNAEAGLVGFSATTKGSPTEIVAIVQPVTSISLSYTTVSEDTTSIIATAFKNLLIANPVLIASGFDATVSSAVVSMFANAQLGQIAYSTALSGGATETLTLASSSSADTITVGGSATNGDGIVLTFTQADLPGGVVNLYYNVATGQSTTVIATALAALINDSAALTDALITATSSSAVVTLAYGPDVLIPVVTKTLYGSETITVSGTPNPTDTVSVTVINVDLPEGSQTASYVVQLADTNDTIATGLALAITNLTGASAADISATASGAIITVLSTSQLQTTYTLTGTTGSVLTGGQTETTETITISQGTATEVLTPAGLTGGSGPVIPLMNFIFTADASYGGDPSGLGSTIDFWNGKPVNVSYQVLQSLVTQQFPII